MYDLSTVLFSKRGILSRYKLEKEIIFSTTTKTSTKDSFMQNKDLIMNNR